MSIPPTKETKTRRGFHDPRPDLPVSGSSLILQCSDGTLRPGSCEVTWDGFCWKTGHGMCEFWSMAHPDVVGWKYSHEATKAERETADRWADQFRPKEYRRYG